MTVERLYLNSPTRLVFLVPLWAGVTAGGNEKRETRNDRLTEQTFYSAKSDPTSARAVGCPERLQ